MNRAHLCTFVAAVLFVGSHSSPSFACTCAKVPLNKVFQAADLVFTGEIVRSEKVDSGSATRALVDGEEVVLPVELVTFRLRESWKGVATDTIEVKNELSGAWCGVDFRVGQLYLVFAKQGAPYGPFDLWTEMCIGTSHIRDARAKEYLQGLGNPERVFNTEPWWGDWIAPKDSRLRPTGHKARSPTAAGVSGARGGVAGLLTSFRPAPPVPNVMRNDPRILKQDCSSHWQWAGYP